MKGKKKIVKVHEEEYLYVTKHAGYNESFADTLKRLLKKSWINWLFEFCGGLLLTTMAMLTSMLF